MLLFELSTFNIIFITNHDRFEFCYHQLITRDLLLSQIKYDIIIQEQIRSHRILVFYLFFIHIM